jgi:hypothetical protein
MRPMECEFESEVLAAAIQSRWPGHVDEELRAHVARCPACSDVAVIGGFIDSAREEVWACASVPDSGRVWRSFQLRARYEAAKTAGRPITVAQGAAFTCAAGLLGACFGATSGWLQSGLRKAASSLAEYQFHPVLPSIPGVVSEHGVLILAAAALLITMPTVIYFAILRD